MASLPIRATWFEWIATAVGNPGQPGDPVVTSVASGLKLDWAASSGPDVDHYVIKRRAAGVGSYVQIATRQGTVFTDQTAIENTNYDYTIEAVDVAGHHSVVRTKASQSWVWPPAKAATPTATSVETGVRLAWTANTEADLDGYNVYRSDTENGVYANLTEISGVTQSPYIDTTAVEDSAYFYKIAAVDENGNEGAKSDPRSFTYNFVP